jgi:hypothetical protein
MSPIAARRAGPDRTVFGFPVVESAFVDAPAIVFGSPNQYRVVYPSGRLPKMRAGILTHCGRWFVSHARGVAVDLADRNARRHAKRCTICRRAKRAQR